MQFASSMQGGARMKSVLWECQGRGFKIGYGSSGPDSELLDTVQTRGT